MINANSGWSSASSENRDADREEVVELYILMPGRQLRALERLANEQGLSIGGIMRRSICHLLDKEPEI